MLILERWERGVTLMVIKELGLFWVRAAGKTKCDLRFTFALHLRPVESLYLSRRVTLPPERARKRPVSGAFSLFGSQVENSVESRRVAFLLASQRAKGRRERCPNQIPFNDLSNALLCPRQTHLPIGDCIQGRNSFRNSFRNSLFALIKNEKYTLGIHLGIHFCDIAPP